MIPAPRRALASAVAVLALAATAAAFPVEARTSDPVGDGGRVVTGIDVASWQHPDDAAIDWRRVAADSGHRFAIIKATESTEYVNPYFVADRDAAQAAGLVVGAYHFATPELPVAASATAQADHFLEIIGTQRLARTLPPVLDLESTGDLSPEEVLAWAQVWLTRVQERTGRTPMLYSFDSFLRTRVGEVEQLAGFPLWLAAYQDAPPAAPGAWSRWRLWQQTSSGAVPGIEGRVDLNVFDGTVDELLRFATGQVPAEGSARTLQPGEPATINGRVDASYAGEPVVLTKRSATGERVVVRSTVIGADGSYTFGIAPRAVRRHGYVVRLDAESPYARVRSETLPVVVEPVRVTASVDAEVVPVGLTARITGRTDEYHAGSAVVLRDASPSGFITYDRGRVRKDGTYSFTVAPVRLGPHVLRVELRSGGKQLATSTTTVVQAVGP